MPHGGLSCFLKIALLAEPVINACSTLQAQIMCCMVLVKTIFRNSNRLYRMPTW